MSSSSTTALATSTLSAGGGGGGGSDSRSSSLGKRATFGATNSSIMHLAAANASDKPHSPLSVLRELLNNPPASAAPSTPSDSGKKLSLTRSGTFAVPSPTVAPWLETRDGDGATPLQCAAFAGHVMATKLLIVAGADLNAADVDGATALHKACARGHVAVIEVLMAADASRDARDHRGQTPLHYAVDADRASALDVLLAHDHEGALFAAADNRGLTLLHRAARRGSRRCLARVRTKFAKRVQPAVVNAVDAEGMTPLHHAALCGSGSCVRQLLALGANAGLLCGGAARLSAAHLAAAAGSVAGLDALLDAQPTLLAATDGSGRTPLDIARSLPKLAAAAAFLEQQERERAPESGESATESGGPAIEVTPRAPAAAQKSVHASISTMEIQNVNRWGFVDPNAQQYAPTEKDIRKEVERGMKWMQMFQQWDKFADSDKLHERVDKGIPDAVRGLAWTRLTGAVSNSTKYAELLAQPSEHAQQIKKDIHRTFPKHILFRDAEGAGQQSLFNVLKCFAVYDKETGYCVPSNHEILTSRGFLDLDAYERAAATDSTLLVASYDVAAKALVFEKPKQLVTYSVDTELVELSNADEMLHVWSADSDSHGLKARRSNGVSMLVTKEHDVFAQLGNASVEKNGSLMPDGSAAAHAKIQAGDLLEPTKTYNAVRQLAVAEAGVQKETVPDVCDELGLRTPHQRALFYEIYGFWLGDGTLKYHGPNAGYVVQFAQVKEADNDWLEASLTELDVQYTKSAASKSGQVQITIQSDAWNRCFAAEYKHAADFINDEGVDDDECDIDDIDADGVDGVDVDVSLAQSSKRKRADVSSEGADAVDADAALRNLNKFATFREATDRHTATALHLQRVRDAVALTNDAIVAPPARAAAVAPIDAEGRAFDTVSTANGSYMQPEGIKSAKWFASWVWRLGAASLRRVLAGLLRADGNTKDRCIYTSSARFRDEIQRVCLMAGYTAFFRCVYKAGTSRGFVQGKAVIATRDSWAVDFADSDGSSAGDTASNPSLFKARGEIRERQYTGRVWCFTMPSGFIWVRRVAKDEHGVVTKASRPLISGNCQGMGFVAGVLLMYLTEEDAFWVLVKIAHNYEMAGMWREGFPHLERGKFVLERLLQTHLKPVAQHLQDEGVMFGIFADKWFMTWFLYTMPFHVVLRIWDGLLGHGFAFIYRAMLALFKLRQNDILESPFEDIVVILKFDGEIGGQTDENKLIETAMSLRIKEEEIEALHAEWATMKNKTPS